MDGWMDAVSYTHLRAHETEADLVCRLLLEKKNAENAMLKNNAFLNRFLLEFFSFWPPKME